VTAELDRHLVVQEVAMPMWLESPLRRGQRTRTHHRIPVSMPAWLGSRLRQDNGEDPADDLIVAMPVWLDFLYVVISP